MTADLGIVGLGTMGSNLALNASDEGFSIVLLDADEARVRSFVEQHSDRRFTGAGDIDEFVGSLERPRTVLLMVPAGEPVDSVLADLAPRLQSDDIVVDGGNSHYEETARRGRELIERHKIRFVGMGVSGGAAGARYGPSLMPGGPREAYDELEETLRAIAADSDAGPCVGYLGPDGTGHFVKMVHNGIEYADMQAIAEAYDLLSRGLGYEAPRLADLFEEWNEGPLESFLIEITAGIFRVRDEESGGPLVERIVDEAAQKGTGRWTAVEALELGVPTPSIVAAVDARVLSSRRGERRRAEERYARPRRPIEIADVDTFLRDVHDALYASRICTFAQGFDLIRHASGEHDWEVPLDEVARVWRAGCIIRSRLLDPIRAALQREPGLENLLLDEEIAGRIEPLEVGWRRAICTSNRIGVPTPCWSSALAYFDGYRTARLPQNLTQAQRDWFGAHTYRRLDDPGGEPVHTEWSERIEAARTGADG